MDGSPDIAWIVIGLITGFGMLPLLRALAITVRNETMIHDLKVGVAEIQVQRFHAEMLRHGVAPQTAEDAETPDDADGPQLDAVGEADDGNVAGEVGHDDTGAAGSDPVAEPARRAA